MRQAPRLRLSWAAPAALCVVAAVGLVRWSSGRSAQAASSATPAASAQASAPRAPEGPGRAAPPPEAARDVAKPLPRSLDGTSVDGALDVGADGHLLVGPRVLLLFDYFFSASGEESDAAIRARIDAYAAAHLGEPALGEARALLDHFVAYRAAAKGLSASEAATPADRLSALKKLRRDHFGDAADALFGDEERAADVAVEKSRAALDPSLSPEEREDRMAAADAHLSEADRRARAQATSALQLRADEQALRAAGADDAEIQRFREGTLGPEAAARLDALDKERAAWKARVAAFVAERDRTCGAAADPSACEASLLERSFDERERIRVRAIAGSAAP